VSAAAATRAAAGPHVELIVGANGAYDRKRALVGGALADRGVT
jgi:L-alanine-DL-glutamate epimerase-like enolase superfamily enzyme